MALEISAILATDGNMYDIKDAEARKSIADIILEIQAIHEEIDGVEEEINAL